MLGLFYGENYPEIHQQTCNQNDKITQEIYHFLSTPRTVIFIRKFVVKYRRIISLNF